MYAGSHALLPLPTVQGLHAQAVNTPLRIDFHVGSSPASMLAISSTPKNGSQSTGGIEKKKRKSRAKTDVWRDNIFGSKAAGLPEEALLMTTANVKDAAPPSSNFDQTPAGRDAEQVSSSRDDTCTTAPESETLTLPPGYVQKIERFGNDDHKRSRVVVCKVDECLQRALKRGEKRSNGRSPKIQIRITPERLPIVTEYALQMGYHGEHYTNATFPATCCAC